MLFTILQMLRFPCGDKIPQPLSKILASIRDQIRKGEFVVIDSLLFRGRSQSHLWKAWPQVSCAIPLSHIPFEIFNKAFLKLKKLSCMNFEKTLHIESEEWKNWRRYSFKACKSREYLWQRKEQNQLKKDPLRKDLLKKDPQEKESLA